MCPAPAAASIDWVRTFSLPGGVPADLPAPDHATYLGDLGLDAGFLYFDRAARRPLDPQFFPTAARFRVRSLPRAVGPDQLIVPRSAGLTAAMPATDLDLERSKLAPIAGAWVAAAPQPGKTMAEVAASRLRWDAAASAAAPLPQPLHTDESLVLHWPDAPAPPPLLAAAVDGILESDAATYLLRSTDTARDGELERDLLRSPAQALVRFEPYRHLLLAGGALQALHPSASGRWLIRILPAGVAIPVGASPLGAARTLAFEHVTVDHAIACVERLVTLQLLRLPDLLALTKFRADVLEQMSWLFRAWIAYLRVVAPVEHPADPNPYATLPAPVRTPFEGSTSAPRARVEGMRTHVLGDAAARTSLLDFIAGYYAPLLCGRSWHALGVEIPIEPAARPAALAVAHRTLEALPHARNVWLLAYAGCPLGRPARMYEPRSPVPAGTPYPLGRLTTFELEAAAIAELTSAEYPDVAAPDVSDRLAQVDLTGFAGDSSAALAVFRAVDPSSSWQEFTTYEWLSEVVKGANRRPRRAPEVDFDADGAAGHPLAGPLGWPGFVEARELHARVGRLDAATVGARTLWQAAIDWWSATTGLRDGAGTWPAVTPAGGDTRTAPSPLRPYRSSATLSVPSPLPFGAGDGTFSSGDPRITGFDEFELEAALRARDIVRNGKSLTTDLDPALVLAALEREGYRASASGERTGAFRDISAAFAPGVLANARNADHIAVVAWMIFPFGLDIFVRNDPLQTIHFTDATLVTTTRTNMEQMFSLRLDAEGLLEPGEPQIAFEFALRYLMARRTGVFLPGGVRIRTQSRTALWVAFTIHHATFQWFHRRLHQAATPRKSVPPAGGNPYVQVPEMIAGTVPPVGADAASDERRRYLAYWALVYLAFNTLPSTWNQWVNAVPDPILAAGTTVSEYLLYHHNAVPTAVEPAAGGAARRLGQRGNQLRFAAALDAYLRLNRGGAAEDTTDPGTRAWAPVP